MRFIRKKLCLSFLLSFFLLACSSSTPQLQEDTSDELFYDLKDTATIEEDETLAIEENVLFEGEEASSAFYITVGGEAWPRMAKALYNNIDAVEELKALNGDIKDQKILKQGVNLYFDMKKALPRPEYLTKDMIERYKKTLAEKIISLRTGNNHQNLEEIVVVKGDTLQKISQKLYGTHRLWTELFLMNADKIAHYDEILPGVSLSYFPEVDFTPPSGVLRSKRLALPFTPKNYDAEKVIQKEEAQNVEELSVGASLEEPSVEAGLEEPSIEASLEEPRAELEEEELGMMGGQEELPPAAQQEARAKNPPALEKTQRKEAGSVSALSQLEARMKRIFPSSFSNWRTLLYGLVLVIVVAVSFFFTRSETKKRLFSSFRSEKKITSTTKPFVLSRSTKAMKEKEKPSPIRKVQ